MSYRRSRTPPSVNTNVALSIDTSQFPPGRTLCKDAVDLLNRRQLSPYQENELQRYINNHLHVICVCCEHGKHDDKKKITPTDNSDLLRRLRSNGVNPYGNNKKGVSWFDQLRARSASPRRNTDDDDSNKKYNSAGDGDGLECTNLKWGGQQRVIRPDDPVLIVPRSTRASSLPLAKRNKKFYYSPLGDGVDSAGLGDPNDVAWGRNAGGNSNAYNSGYELFLGGGYGSNRSSPFEAQNGYGRASPSLRVGGARSPSGQSNGYSSGLSPRGGYGSSNSGGYGGHSPRGGGAGYENGYGGHSPRGGYGNRSGRLSPHGGYDNDRLSPRGGYDSDYGRSGGMGQRNGFGGSQPSLYSDDGAETPLSFRHGYDFERARNAYITNPRALIHEYATKTLARETSRSPLPSPRPPSQAEDYNFAPYAPYRAVGSGHDPKKFVRQVRDNGLTHTQKSANRNLEPVHKSPLPKSIDQLKAIAAKKGDNVPGTKEIDFLTGCMLHNLYTGKGAAPESWE